MGNDLSALLNEEHIEPLSIPWPNRGERYECVLAIAANQTGLLIHGNNLVMYYCSEVSYDLEEITDINMRDTKPGIYRATLKYWATSQYLYGSGETEFEDGFEVSEMVEIPYGAIHVYDPPTP